MQHDWTKSTLGHGNTMCRRCFITDMEAAAIGILNDCDGASAPPLKPTNDNVVPLPVIRVEHLDDDGDEHEEDGPEPGEDCGRWDNGKLMKQCRKAGSEECDWECPIGLPRC